jgi:hypothetical protein
MTSENMLPELLDIKQLNLSVLNFLWSLQYWLDSSPMSPKASYLFIVVSILVVSGFSPKSLGFSVASLTLIGFGNKSNKFSLKISK